MSLDAVIKQSERPHTRASLSGDLRALGVEEGGCILVHTSLSALGFVAGGAVTVIDAVLDAIGAAGTLVIPAQSSDLTDPAQWSNPPIPPHWVDTVRAAMPGYDPARTPTFQMGVVPELFRTWPGVLRSGHPTCSFAASGPQARSMLEPHLLDDPFGEMSPLARLYAHDAQILLLGAGWHSCTALHLAERRAAPDALPEKTWSPIMREGRRQEVLWDEYDHDADRFPGIGEALERRGLVSSGAVGEARCRLVRLRVAVDFAVEALARQVKS
jgi:aminoglycoside 3-N-acetyltransferase